RPARLPAHASGVCAARPVLLARPDGGCAEGVVMTAARPPEPAGIRLDRISQRFRGGVGAVQDVTLEVAPGEFLVLVGPSGCGKSTILRLIAGLEEVSGGRIHIGEKD